MFAKNITISMKQTEIELEMVYVNLTVTTAKLHSRFHTTSTTVS